MASNPYDQIVKFDAAPRLHLTEDLLYGRVSETFATSLTKEHRTALQARVAYQRAHPGERTSTHH